MGDRPRSGGARGGVLARGRETAAATGACLPALSLLLSSSQSITRIARALDTSGGWLAGCVFAVGRKREGKGRGLLIEVRGGRGGAAADDHDGGDDGGDDLEAPRSFVSLSLSRPGSQEREGSNNQRLASPLGVRRESGGGEGEGERRGASLSVRDERERGGRWRRSLSLSLLSRSLSRCLSGDPEERGLLGPPRAARRVALPERQRRPEASARPSRQGRAKRAREAARCEREATWGPPSSSSLPLPRAGARAPGLDRGGAPRNRDTFAPIHPYVVRFSRASAQGGAGAGR